MSILKTRVLEKRCCVGECDGSQPRANRTSDDGTIEREEIEGPRGTMSGSEEAVRDEDRTRESKVLPLNSRRLTVANLRKIAHGMSLPVNVPGTELRQLIDGKLIGMGKEPRNVQVVIVETESGVERLSLRDEGGIFVDAGDSDLEAETPEVTPLIDLSSVAGDDEAATSTEEMQHELQVVTEENKRLKEELTIQQVENAETREGMERLQQEVWTCSRNSRLLR